MKKIIRYKTRYGKVFKNKEDAQLSETIDDMVESFKQFKTVLPPADKELSDLFYKRFPKLKTFLNNNVFDAIDEEITNATNTGRVDSTKEHPSNIPKFEEFSQQEPSDFYKEHVENRVSFIEDYTSDEPTSNKKPAPKLPSVIDLKYPEALALATKLHEHINSFKLPSLSLATLVNEIVNQILDTQTEISIEVHNALKSREMFKYHNEKAEILDFDMDEVPQETIADQQVAIDELAQEFALKFPEGFRQTFKFNFKSCAELIIKNPTIATSLFYHFFDRIRSWKQTPDVNKLDTIEAHLSTISGILFFFMKEHDFLCTEDSIKYLSNLILNNTDILNIVLHYHLQDKTVS